MEFSHPPSRKKQNFINRYFLKLHTLKASDAFLLKIAMSICVLFLVLFLIQLSQAGTTQIPAVGGTFSEGIIGTPRFINPILAVTRADKDLSALIYTGLMTLGKDGVLVPNIAESVTISEDGLTYNVILRKDVVFHDGTQLTARDVGFTVTRIQDPLLASPLRVSFDGITVEEIGEFELNFILPEPYAPFIENLSFGILPEHIWKDASSEEFPFSQFNSEPIGTGPFAIQKIIRNASGIPETYILQANTTYHLGTPKIEKIVLQFFPTEEKLMTAFHEEKIDSVVGVDPIRLTEYNVKSETHHLERIPLPRTFAVFINQNKSPALRDSTARKALDLAVDRNALVSEMLGGYGNPLMSPIPTGFGIAVQQPERISLSSRTENARDILRDGGWKLNPEKQIWEKDIDGTPTLLAFSIATVNNSGFETTAELLRNAWVQLGAEVTIKQFEQADLTQAIIRPRDYEALLFGTQLGRALDFYSFWHSSQRTDPGLNVALYANITTDSILSEMRRSTNMKGRNEAIQKFANEINIENPAIFLYAPELLYIFPNEISGASFNGVSEPHERFSNIQDWYIETESVWPFFTQ